MDEQLTQKITLEMRDCDAQGRWKPSCLLRQMQETGEAHSKMLGFSRTQLLEKGMCWVVYRLKYRMDEDAMFGDELSVTTWPGAVQGPLFPRYFSVEKDGRQIGEAATAWVLFDVESRRILRPNRLPGTYEPAERQSGLGVPGALKMPDMRPADARRVRYTDLDMNGHMNNARYADWISDALCDGNISELQINYISEARLGEEITIRTGEDGMLAGEHEDGKTVFEARAAVKGNG